MRRVLFSALALALLTGCYTVLRHPRVEPGAEEASPVVLRSDCAACHSDWDLDRYGYTFHPGWYPLAGAWPRWYYDPWWWDVVRVEPQPAPDGVQVKQSAGLRNDRGAAGGSATTPGIWMPGGGAPSGIVTVPNPGPQPQSGDPPDASNAPSPGSTGRSGSPAETPARPGASTATESGPAPAERVDEPRQGSGSTATPAPRDAGSAGSPRSSDRTGGPAKQPADAGRAATPSPSPPSTPPKQDRVEPKPSQGRGMPNDRGEPKP